MNADASAAEFEGTLDHRWISQLAVLDKLLRADGFYISPDRWLNIADLLTNLMLQNGIAKNQDYHLNVKQYLSPLICKSAREQQEFSRIFSHWWQDVYPVELDPKAPTQQHKTAKRWSNSVLAVLFLLVIMAISALVYFNSMEPIPEAPEAASTVQVDENIPKDNTEEETPQPAAPLTPQPTKADIDNEQYLAPHVEQNIPPLLSLTDRQKSWLAFLQLALVSVIPLFILLSLLIGGFRPMLRKGKADKNNPLRFIKLQFDNDNLFDTPKLRAALRSLHVPLNIMTKRLHPKRTVYASLHHGGLFTPIYATRTEVPEILIWVNNKGKLDPVQAMADTLVQRLRAADLSVSVYSYRNRPNRLLDRSSDQWVSANTVQALHPGARIILITGSQSLIDLLTQKPLNWVTELANQFNTVVLEPGAQHMASVEALKAANIACNTLSSEGIAQVCGSFSQIQQTIATKLSDTQRLAFLPQYLNQAERWRSPVAPNKKERHLLLAVLQTYLGPAGYTLLCASAAYPEFRWGLVRALDLSLFSQDEAITRETRLLLIAQLPWARDGWLPEWLRLALMRSQDKHQYAKVRMLYQQLLVEVEAHGQEGIKLPVRIQKSDNNVLSYLRQWFTRSKPNSDLEDSVFVELMLGGRFRRLDFELPRALSKILPVSISVRRFITATLLVGCALYATLGLNQLANYYQLQQKVEQLWRQAKTPGNPLSLQIYHNAKSGLLAEHLQSLLNNLEGELNQPIIETEFLKDDLFKQAMTENGALSTDVKQKIQTSGVVIYQTGFQQQAQWLADRVTFASKGLTPNVFEQSNFSNLEFVKFSRPQLILWLPEESISKKHADENISTKTQDKDDDLESQKQLVYPDSNSLNSSDTVENENQEEDKNSIKNQDEIDNLASQKRENNPEQLPSISQGEIENISSRMDSNDRVARIWNAKNLRTLVIKLSAMKGLGKPTVIAVMAVESNIEGFNQNNKGRMIIRFENHKFWKYWGQHNPQQYRQHFRYSDNKVWRGHQWRRDAGGEWLSFHGQQVSEWQVFEFARQLDEKAAMLSISMGAPQIMGFLYETIGFESVKSMFANFSESIDNQYMGLFNFLSPEMLNYLKEKDFEAFAGRYNGQGQKTIYGKKLKDHYEAASKLLASSIKSVFRGEPKEKEESAELADILIQSTSSKTTKMSKQEKVDKGSNDIDYEEKPQQATRGDNTIRTEKETLKNTLNKFSTNQACIDVIKKYQEVRLNAFKGPAGNWLIGYGHKGGVTSKMTISQNKAEELLRADLKEVEDNVNLLVKVNLNRNQFSALVCLAYNIGLGNFARSTLLLELNKGDFVGASDQFLVWKMSNGKISPNLVKRRAHEKAIFDLSPGDTLVLPKDASGDENGIAELDGDSNRYFEEGLSSLKNGELLAAFENFKRASEINKSNIVALTKMHELKEEIADKYHREASAAFRRQDLDLAIKKWDIVLKVMPKHSSARIYRAQALELKERLKNIKVGSYIVN